jgi:rubrerythrin
MTITLGQAIRNAIEAEKAAEQFYLELAGVAREADTQAFLRRVAGEERAHAAGLERVARQLGEGELPDRADMPVAGIESAPGLAGARDLAFVDALTLALEAEDSAALFYDGLASSCTGEAAELFVVVRDQEERHAAQIRGVLRAGRPPRDE